MRFTFKASEKCQTADWELNPLLFPDYDATYDYDYDLNYDTCELHALSGF